MKEELKILMLEDTPDDAGLIERELRKQGLMFEAQRVDGEAEFRTALTTFAPDLILSDHALPQFNSINALKICRIYNPNIPFILVTGTVSEEFAVSCLKQGADDYVLKSNLVRLPSAIISALRQRDHEATRLRAEIALREQNDELKKINSELDSFVYSVSHNLRAPLMSVLGLIQVVEAEHESRNEQLTRYFGMMRHSVNKLDETLREILEYSRNSRMAVHNEPVDIRGLIDRSIENLRFMPGFDDLGISLEVCGNPVVFCDAYRLSTVVHNLVSNTVKYRDKSKGQCTLKVLVSISDSTIELLFQDNGIGITKTLLPRIFEMFFRATDRGEGAGLGLYIVRETIAKLKGSIEVQSVLGEGTTIEIVLPRLIK